MFQNWYMHPLMKDQNNNIVKKNLENPSQIHCLENLASKTPLIFQHKHTPVDRIPTKSIMIEVVNTYNINPDWGTDIGNRESNWIIGIQPQDYRRIHEIKPQLEHSWAPKVSFDDMSRWLLSQQFHTLFFDGASKGNPCKASTGGVI